MEEDGERGGVGREDDDLGDTTVEGLGRLVGTLLQLTVVAGLLDNVEDLLGEGRVGDGPSWEWMLDFARDEKACYVGNLPAPEFCSSDMLWVGLMVIREMSNLK